MIKTSYQDLIDSRDKYDSMLLSLGVKQKQNRWDEAYKLVQQLENVRMQNKTDEIDIKTFGRMRFALTDLNNLNLILDCFEGDISEVFRNKFKDMLGGSINQVEEVSTSSCPRDTQFELLMCAKFREKGFNAQLGKINPDIVVKINGRKYGFECKRIFNFNQGAVQRNIEKAIDQLNNSFLDKDYSKRGLPLLCIDRYVTGGDKILNALDENSVRSILGGQIQEFVDNHYRRWNGPKVKDGRIIGVMMFMNITAELKLEGLPVVCHQFGISNNGWAGWSKLLFNDFVTDFANSMGPIEFSKLK